jgi:putative acetyltransferase
MRRTTGPPSRSGSLAIQIVGAAVRGRVGIGRRILAELETLARKHGMPELAMDASLNAEDFYAKRGFTVVEKGEHALRGGARMS